MPTDSDVLCQFSVMPGLIEVNTFLLKIFRVPTDSDFLFGLPTLQSNYHTII